MISVLFVCLGNICRSPMAEAVFRHLVHEAGLEKTFHIDSAGTGDWHVGKPPHRGTKKKLDEVGISYAGIQARQLEDEDLSRFDYLIGMDDTHIDRLFQIAKETNHSTDNVYSLVDLIPNCSYQDVPDPYYTGDFEETYTLVQSGCKQLLAKIRKEHSLVPNQKQTPSH